MHLLAAANLLAVSPASGDAALGTRPYERFERPQACAACHTDIARQHEQALMSQAYTHAWDEIEYFELAVPHAEKEPKVAGVKAGCKVATHLSRFSPEAFPLRSPPPRAEPTSRSAAISATRSPASRGTSRTTSTGSSPPGA